MAANQFPDGPSYPADTLRDALALPPGCPLVQMDARAPHSALDTLVTLVEHTLARSTDRVSGTDRTYLAPN